MALPTLTHDTTDSGVWHGHPLFSLENIYRAYRRCRRRKRATCNALSFEQDLEENLCGAGMGEHENGRAVFPWPLGLLEKIHQWLNSYLAHFGKGSSYRLTLRLRERFDWLDEYFKWVGANHTYLYRSLTITMRNR